MAMYGCSQMSLMTRTLNLLSMSLSPTISQRITTNLALSLYGNHFWLLYDGDRLISFVDGFVTDDADLTDEMYENAAMHNESGAWQMILGVNTLPAYRQHGYAGKLLQKAIADAKEQGRKGVVLTCKSRLVHYYAKFGFEDEGVTDKSTHGNVAWHQMRLTF